MQTLISKRAEAAERGLVLGVYQSSSALARFMGQASAGTLFRADRHERALPHRRQRHGPGPVAGAAHRAPHGAESMSEPRCYMIVIAHLSDRQRFLDGYAPRGAAAGGKVRRPLRHPRQRRQLPRGRLVREPERAGVGVPSKAAALAFWNSPEYAAAKQLRAGAGDFQVLLIEAA
jgi:hypothetical protein